MRVRWTVPESTIAEAICIYCNETGDVEWTNQHLKEKKYYLLPKDKLKNRRGVQFVVTKKTEVIGNG